MNKEKYSVYCPECETTREVVHKPKTKNAPCKSCVSKASIKKAQKARKKAEKDKKRYFYFCPTCPSVRATAGKRKTSYCSECTKYLSKQDVKSISALLEIKNRNSSVLGSEKTRNSFYYKKAKKRRRESSKTVDGMQKVKIGHVSFKKRNDEDRDAQMIAEYEKKNKITVIEPSIDFDSYETGCKVNIKSTY